MTGDPGPVPVFPEFKEVGLEDRGLFEGLFERFPQSACEMNFPNILIWKRSEHPRYTFINGDLCILVSPDFEHPYFLPPVGDGPLLETVGTCLKTVPRISRVTEEMARELEAGGFTIAEDPGNADYVYSTKDLAGLHGKHFDGKRNRIRKFERTYRYTYEPLENGRSAGCLEMMSQWTDEKTGGEPGPFVMASRQAVAEALELFPGLGMFGGVVLVEDRVRAFTMASRLNRDTAVVHFEFADPAMTGLAQFINREFAGRGLATYEFANREQDLGLPGLRTAKMSYRPCRLVKKYDVR